jgi:hyperosmotically inducible protein
MRIDRRLLVLGITFAGALPVLIAGCSNQPDPLATPPATTSVGTEIDDTAVTSKVKSALFADPGIKSFDLKVETRKGEVQLSGFVDNQDQVERAISTTRAVEGVRSIQNGISLKAAGTTTVGSVVDDGIITTRVKSALLADPGVKSFDIAVVTRTGVVQLSGFVDSQVQIDQAIALARKVEGVTRVGNEMSIKK